MLNHHYCARVTQSIVVRWDPLPDELTNGIITGYRVRYRQNRDRQQIVVAVDGTQAQCTLSSESICIFLYAIK